MNQENEIANRIVARARSWIGTRFAHQGRLKADGESSGGVDCLGLVVGVARELDLRRDGKLLYKFDNRNYGHMPDSRELIVALTDLLTEIEPNEIRLGDILLIRIINNPQHLGIVSDYSGGLFGIIHSHATAGKVVEHRLDEQWSKRIVSAYRYIE